jgi:hypothetical protein
MLHMFQNAVDVASRVASLAIVVDPIDAVAQSFYENRYGFQPLMPVSKRQIQRLYLSMKDAAKLLRARR